jgi:hypothetical protein
MIELNTMLLALYKGVLMATVFFALRKGDEPEQLTSLMLLTAVFADSVNHWLFGTPNYFTINPGHLVLDCWSLIVMVWVGLYANRGWPLWVAALQMIVVAGHLSKLFDISEIRRGYWVMIAVPGYFQLLVLWIGLVAHMRRIDRIGRHAPWRPRHPEPPASGLAGQTSSGRASTVGMGS